MRSSQASLSFGVDAIDDQRVGDGKCRVAEQCEGGRDWTAARRGVLVAGAGASFGLSAPLCLYDVAIDEPFVINLADAPAIGAPRGATFIRLEPDGVTWPDTGVNVQVIDPGEPNGRYHSEPVQEDFLVLYGECIAIVDDEERALRQWDFLHCPAGSEHVFVGAGGGPCGVLMIGSPREDACRYTVNDTAAKYDASVSKETDNPAEAYADWRAEGPDARVPNPWPFR